ncbi:hypothetical protein SAMN05444365_101843 [Micromonospora pattaloongensis]|uniref:Uncharacterized protein n=2 Tax=Micromonospora pattaloongensis TaxID=405436 RepID=A0A1H3HJP8_9ACTN|nr:hypothetical protein SAMN05444365_101843 [Micromonospora pattaloongensis]
MELEIVLRAAWSAATCDPVDLPDWHPGNPARGQCGVTALVLQDLLGGDLMLGQVHVDGEQIMWHWWNRLPGGLEVDLTREQFAPHEVVVGGEMLERPAGPPKRCREQYELLRARVLDALGTETPAAE